MRKSDIFAMALAAAMMWTGCLKVEEMPVEEPKAQAQVFTMKVRADREMPDQVGHDGTKGLDLTGTTLNTIWRNTESVSVFANGAYLAETLGVTPDSENASRADLSGSVTITGIRVNDEIKLQVPRRTWDYTGQKGILLGADVAGSIEKDYSYALASVTVSGITPGEGNAGTLTTTNAHFQNQQHIYRLSFKHNDLPLAVTAVTISSSKNKIVLSRNLSTGTTTYGALTVNMATSSSDLEDGLVCVALRNDDETAQDYFFSVTGSDGLTYVGSKSIPAEAFSHGFLGIKNLPLSKLSLSMSSTQVNEVL